MAYLIDSDILIFSLRGDRAITDQLRLSGRIPKAISVITYGELIFGAKNSEHPARNIALILKLTEIFPIIDVSRTVMDIFSGIKADLRKAGRSIDDMDILIAATALSRNDTLVTNNTKHFARIPDLRLENWM